jgi:hypothetical protein
LLTASRQAKLGPIVGTRRTRRNPDSLELAMTAYLIVRAEVDPSVKDAFDAWYQNEHLPDAHRGFGALTAMRGWSSEQPNLHVAFYGFPNREAAAAILGSEVLQGFIREFDAHWAGQVVRSRDIVEIRQEIGPPERP